MGHRSSPLLIWLMHCSCTAPKAWSTGIPSPLGPPSSCGPPQAALGPTRSSKVGTTYLCEMPSNSGRWHDKGL